MSVTKSRRRRTGKKRALTNLQIKRGSVKAVQDAAAVFSQMQETRGELIRFAGQCADTFEGKQAMLLAQMLGR